MGKEGACCVLRHGTSSRLAPVLFFLLFLLVCCGPWGLARAAGSAMSESVDVFKAGKIRAVDRLGDAELELYVHSIHSALLVAADGLMVALATVGSNDRNGVNVDVLARHIETEGDDWVKNITEDNGAKWTTQLVVEKREGGGHLFALRNPVAVAKDNQIYLLVVNHKKKSNGQGHWKVVEWDFELAVGVVKFRTDAQGTRRTIEWRPSESLNTTLTRQFKDMFLVMPPHDGPRSAFVTQGGEIVFGVRAKNISGIGLAVIRLRDAERTREWEVSFIPAVDDCYPHFLFEWGGRLMMFVFCLDNKHKLRESIDGGRTWRDNLGAMFFLSDQLGDKRDFITATIDNKTALLFTQIRDRRRHSEEKYGSHLWLSDGNRVHNMGPIVTDNTHVASFGLVYRNGELFFLHRRWNAWSETLVLTALRDKLEDIKSLLSDWTETDKYFSRPCNETAARGGMFCRSLMPTVGLVGFLSGNGDNSVWRDEYHYVDALVAGATRMREGFRFSGPRAGAKWPVGNRWRIQQYHFMRHGMTVVATVTIHSSPENINSPLLTIGGANISERLGLWYDTDKKWRLVVNDVGVSYAHRWVENKTYCVMLLLHNTLVTLYVNGVNVGFLVHAPTFGGRSLDIKSIFIGEYDDDRVEAANVVRNVTVSNVLLYNRPLNDSELSTIVGGPNGLAGDRSF